MSSQGQGEIDDETKQRILALSREIGDTRYEVRSYKPAEDRWKTYVAEAEKGRSVGVVTPAAVAVAMRVGRLLQVRLGGKSYLEKHVWQKALADANFENANEAHVVFVLEETWLRFYTHLRRLYPPL